MWMKKRSVCMVFLFVLFPVTVYGQMGLYELSRGGMAAELGFTGLDFSSTQDAMGIGGSLSYGISSRTQIALIANMGIVDEDRYNDTGLDVPPPVAIGIRPMHVSSLGRTGLDYFFTGTVYTGFSSGISYRLDDPTDATLFSVRTNGFGGGSGILKRIETGFGWRLNPFCGVSYSRSWTHIGAKNERDGDERNRTYSGFGAKVGLEVELSPAISMIGTYGFSLEDFDGAFSIGLSLH